ITLGIYASKKSLSATFIEGNIYQQSVELIRTLSQKYELTLVDKTVNKDDTIFTEISNLMEKESDFSITDEDHLTPNDAIEVWQVV
ncbi:hypothetical protein, partial [Ralstonia pseudosolanacearum]|uniref:hypothetical protein n=1 Tax=Ralstonia pseudosolanacearum TaxID=1310165 RepID=UPI003CE76E73